MTAVEVSAQLGLLAAWLLTLDILLGLLLSARYNPYRSWPHRRLNYFTLHNWTGYIALGLSAAHALVLPLSTTAGWLWRDVAWPAGVAQQPTENVLGAVALYLLLLVVATSYVRRRVGRDAWKAVHYTSYACAALFFAHGLLLDPRLLGRPVDWLDAEKVSLEVCILAVAVGTFLRVRWAVRRRARAAGAGKDLRQWDAPVPADWSEA